MTPDKYEPWALPNKQEKVFTFKVNRNIALACLLSILLHLSLLWLFAPKLFSLGAPEKDAPPLQITLGPPQEKESAPSEEVLPDLRPLPQPIPAPPKEKPRPKPVKKTKPKQRPVETVTQSKNKIVQAEKLNKQVPQPKPQPTSPQPLPGEDMQAYIRRQQAAKLAKKGLSERDVEEVLASNKPQSAGEKRDATIQKNLDLDGTNGIFSIRHLSARSAQFSFKGWKTNINTARLEIIDVKAAAGEDIRKAVIRKMIAIIRREYNGDFKWDSRRLNRVITLSARQQDTQTLVNFMMLEFFGPGTPYGLRY